LLNHAITDYFRRTMKLCRTLKTASSVMMHPESHQTTKAKWSAQKLT